MILVSCQTNAHLKCTSVCAPWKIIRCSSSNLCARPYRKVITVWCNRNIRVLFKQFISIRNPCWISPLWTPLIWILGAYEMMCMNKTAAYTHLIFSLTYTHTPSFCITEQTQLYSALLPRTKRKFPQQAAAARGQPEQAVWAWVRDKAIGQGSVLRPAEGWARSSQCNVQYAVHGQVLQPGNRRGSLGFPHRVSQPAALRGILEGTVLGCDTALANALCRLTKVQNNSSKIYSFLFTLLIT